MTIIETSITYATCDASFRALPLSEGCPMPFKHKGIIGTTEAVVGSLTDRQKLLIDLAIEIDRSTGDRRNVLIGVYDDVRRQHDLAI